MVTNTARFMKAAVVPRRGADWVIESLPVPEPGPRQVLVKVRASALSFTDIEQANGQLPMDYPGIVGHEVAGDIVAVGTAVTKRRVGDRVGVPYLQTGCGRCEWCLRGRPILCPEHKGTSSHMPGGHAEYLPAFEEAAMLLPDGLSHTQAAPLLGAGYTVWSGLRRAEPFPAQRVAVIGIGGLGHLALQYAKAAGFTTIAVTRSLDKAEYIREKFKADLVVDSGEALERAGGADIVLATGTSTASMQEGIKGMRADATLVVMGYEDNALSIPLKELIMLRMKIVGSRANHPEHLHEALQIAAAGKVEAVVETYAIDDINIARKRLIEGKVRYRAVIEF